MRGWTWGKHSKSGVICHRKRCGGERGARRTGGRRRGFMGSPMRSTGSAGRRPRGWPGWSARRCATPCCATTPRASRGCTTGQRDAAPPAHRGRGGRARRGDPAGARSRTGRLLRLDACRSLPLARGALRQDLSPVEHDAGAQAPDDVAPEGAPLSPAARPRGPGGLQKRGLATSIAEAAAHHPDKRVELWFEE
jgi:hypothetical protein